VSVSPATCLRCRGRKWKVPELKYLRCPRCKNTGCRFAEPLPADFDTLPPHPQLVTGPDAAAGEIRDAR